MSFVRISSFFLFLSTSNPAIVSLKTSYCLFIYFSAVLIFSCVISKVLSNSSIALELSDMKLRLLHISFTLLFIFITYLSRILHIKYVRGRKGGNALYLYKHTFLSLLYKFKVCYLLILINYLFLLKLIVSHPLLILLLHIHLLIFLCHIHYKLFLLFRNILLQILL